MNLIFGLVILALIASTWCKPQAQETAQVIPIVSQSGNIDVDGSFNYSFVVLLLAFVADNTHDSIIEDAEIVMEIYPTTNSTHDIHHENLKILATGCGNATEDVISLNNDVYNTVFVSKNNVSFSNTEEILRDNTDESQLPESLSEHFVQGNGNEDNNNKFEKTSKINILQNIIQNNDDGPHYKADEVDANNLQHKEDCSESEDPCYLPEKSSNTNELEGEQEEEAIPEAMVFEALSKIGVEATTAAFVAKQMYRRSQGMYKEYLEKAKQARKDQTVMNKMSNPTGIKQWATARISVGQVLLDANNLDDITSKAPVGTKMKNINLTDCNPGRREYKCAEAHEDPGRPAAIDSGYYEAGNGIRVQEGGYLKKSELRLGDADGGGDIQVIVGAFSYKSPEGTDISLQYTADENGFHPVGEHLPTPPPIPPAIQRALSLLSKLEKQQPQASFIDIATENPNNTIQEGYPVEVHKIETEDGYILQTVRVSFGKGKLRSNRSAVVMFSGVVCSPADFVNMGKNSLAFMLADSGYDVWLGSVRGSTLSKKHRIYSAIEHPQQFFNFSIHEIGYYDISANIDYIRNVTEEERLYYVGFSQGATAFYILTATRPEYNRYIRIMVGLSSAMHLHSSKHLVLKLLHAHMNKIEELVETFQWYEIFPYNPMLSVVSELLCNEKSMFQHICVFVLHFLGGYGSLYTNKALIPIIASNIPAGASFLQLKQYAQIASSRRFQQLDYGKESNLKRYGTIQPPAYDISKITSPVAVYYGSADSLVSVKDNEYSISLLPNVVFSKKINGYNHLDVMWGLGVQEKKQVIKKYGYPLEVHTVTTEDGYILELHRIPHGRHNAQTSASWLTLGPEDSLAFMLADQGYDVWQANYRGTIWSMQYETLDEKADEKEYFNFS
ncbi:hypothetical protein FQA39_LY13753 [Lamprigera yunnana]|nr:hypothetical protein FQA39_LY13753 [Lamprigera yunnana]